MHVRGNQRRKAIKHSYNYSVRIFPDLLLTSFKERQVSRIYKEKNLESAAIEIKYYRAGRNGKDLRRSISRDLDKLIEYQRRNFKPRVDCGFFFCFDESGKAEDVLRGLFRHKRYRNRTKPLGYGIIVPSYADKNMPYPGHFESYENSNKRRVKYLAEHVRAQMGELAGNKVSEDPYSFWLKLRSQSIRWVAFLSPQNVKNSGGKYSVIVRLRPDYKGKFLKCPRYIWTWQEKRYVQSYKSGPDILIYALRKDVLNNIEHIEKQGDKIAKLLKRFTRP